MSRQVFRKKARDQARHLILSVARTAADDHPERFTLVKRVLRGQVGVPQDNDCQYDKYSHACLSGRCDNKLA
jgi:hypothetical protein